MKNCTCSRCVSDREMDEMLDEIFSKVFGKDW
jgi:hypothetical protein